ncbi:MAG: excinuclease abc c subunit domain protein [Parcubacteria group bacterium Gr01-1014_30]|nr:MAG: excinuclease abc c subunit domain protein [Parcubacteria group bacterium Gr01-1014_30]
MYWVYIIKSELHSKLYIGRTNDLSKRLKDHNSGRSPSTKKYIPWKPVYIEGYAVEQDAKDREEKMKYFGKVYSQLKIRIRRSLRS